MALLGRANSKLDEFAEQIKQQGGQALAIQCDVSDEASVDNAVARTVHDLGPVDIAVNNAGMLGAQA